MPIYANIGGARKELDNIYINIGGARKELESMYANVGGARKEIFSSGVKLSSLLVGEIVNITENDALSEFYIAHQNYYTNNSTVLIRKYLLPDSKTFASFQSYLTNTYLSWFPSWTTNLLNFIPLSPGSAKVTLASKEEYNTFEYFSSMRLRAAKKVDGSGNIDHWTRTEEYGGLNRYYKQYINISGGILENQKDSSKGLRPIISISSDLLVVRGVLVQP